MKKQVNSTILSCLLWGSGQFFVCKQRIKGLLFFAAQVLLVGIELMTGYWFNYFAGQIPVFKLRLYGGFFTKGIWGLITLGEVPGVHGDHSTMLMVKGLIALLLLLIFLGIYILNIVDAHRSGKAAQTAPRKHTSAQNNLLHKLFPYIVLTPVALLVIFIVFMPIIFTVLTGFTNYDSDHTPPGSLVNWVGFVNFIKLFSIPVWSQTFIRVLLWTVIWTILSTLTAYCMGLMQALVLNSKHVKHKAFFRSIYILPWAIPGMITLLMFRNILNGQFGPLNQFLMDAHLISQRIDFLTNALYAKISIIAVNLWMTWPMFFVMLSGVICNQDPNWYEAAQIDGANKFQVFARIKFPLLFNATAPLVIMNMAANFNAFGTIYFLTEGKPTGAAYQFSSGETDILISWIYKLTLDQKTYSMAAVMVFLLFLFIAAISLWNFRRTNAFKEV